MADAHADISKHIKSYIMVFVALAVLTVVTVLVAQVQMSHVMGIVVALAIAAFKASLVAAIFMHLKWERSGNIWFVLVLCAFFFAVLILLPTIIEHDHPVGTTIGTWG